MGIPGGFSVWEVAAMRMVLSVTACDASAAGEAVLYDRLRFAHAIRRARGPVREKHAYSGCTASVEMVCAEFTIALVHYTNPATPQRAAA